MNNVRHIPESSERIPAYDNDDELIGYVKDIVISAQNAEMKYIILHLQPPGPNSQPAWTPWRACEFNATKQCFVVHAQKQTLQRLCKNNLPGQALRKADLHTLFGERDHG